MNHEDIGALVHSLRARLRFLVSAPFDNPRWRDAVANILEETDALDTLDTLDRVRQSLEERISYAEQARDNAIAMRDEADTRRRQAGESAGRRINGLVKLIRHIMRHSGDERAHVEAIIADILSADPPTPPTTPATPEAL